MQSYLFARGLKGVVDNESDATIAYVQANSTPGTISVDKGLIVFGAPPKEPK